MTVFYTYFVHNIKKQFLPIKTVKVVDIIILNHYYRFIQSATTVRQSTIYIIFPRQIGSLAPTDREEGCDT